MSDRLDRLKITINNVLLEDNEKLGFTAGEAETAIKIRLPFNQNSSNGYLWFNKSDIIKKDNNGMSAYLDPDATYKVYNPMNGSTSNEKGEDIYTQHFIYNEKFDPNNQEAARVKAENQRVLDQRRQNAAASRTQTVNKQKNQHTAMQNVNQNMNQQMQSNAQQAIVNQQVNNRQQALTYNKEQFNEIKKGVRAGLDARLYSNIRLSAAQMHELRLSLKRNIDITRFNNEHISAEHMKEIRLGHDNGVGISIDKLNHSLYNAEQMKELRLGLEQKVNVNKYLNPAYNAEQMKEIRTGLKANINTESYESIYFTASQMHAMKSNLVIHEIVDKLKELILKIRDELMKLTDKLINKILGENTNKSAEEIMDVKIREAVEDIKDILIQTELVDENAFDNVELNEAVNSRIKYAVNDIINLEHPSEADINTKLTRASVDVLKETGNDVMKEVNNEYSKIADIKHYMQASDDYEDDLDYEMHE